MKVLITGGNGLLGHNTILRLLLEGHIVHAIVRKRESLLVQHDNLYIFEGNFLDYDSLRAYSSCNRYEPTLLAV